MAIKFGNKIIIYTKIYYYNKFGPLDSTNGSQITSVPRGRCQSIFGQVWMNKVQALKTK